MKNPCRACGAARAAGAHPRYASFDLCEDKGLTVVIRVGVRNDCGHDMREGGKAFSVAGFIDLCLRCAALPATDLAERILRSAIRP